jgi:alkylation response protein AidB-like acyl-CoA dehydrogenase
MAGVYLGVAQSAYDTAVAHVLSRRHSHSGDSLADQATVQARIADLWLTIEQARLALYNAARLGDLGSPDAPMAILGCKILAAEASVSASNEAMTLCGGIAYRENSTLSRLLRDARASHVMAPTTEMLRQWVGRTALGLPLL